VNALPAPEHNNEAVLAAIPSSAGTLYTHVSHWRRRPPGYLAIFSTFARLRPNPVITVHLFLLQILHGNTACRHLPHLAGFYFSASAYCQARAKLPVRVLEHLSLNLSLFVEGQSGPGL
jgi:hypothetical protein